MRDGAKHFDDKYAQTRDPWGYRHRWYEARKRALTLAMLPEQRYARAFEPGCSIGELTAALAPRCDALLACDFSPFAAAAARRRVSTLPNVLVTCDAVPAFWPQESFDLIVISELGYYLDVDALDDMADKAWRSLDADGTIVACHWRHPIPEGPLTGDSVHARLRSERGVVSVGHYEDADALIDVWCRKPPA